MTEPPCHLASAELERWFSRHGRNLPWRLTRDPWAILVSEMMLQQTQVSRVEQRWPRFLQRFPTVESCAAAPASDVIDEWSGLGYNRRAVNLHRLAGAVVQHHGGRFPDGLAELLALPGIGPYTARAVRVFAFERRDAVLDTNVARIMARTMGRQLGRREAQDTADANLGADPWVWNQAVLDVGALYCTARSPACEDCPLQSACRWWAAGLTEPDPAVGSAGVSGGQSSFEGSDRQGRGRLVNALRAGPIGESDLAQAMGWPDDPSRASLVAATLVADGLVQKTECGFTLPR